jgi:two-component system sensor histidine kinase RegB
MHKLVSPYHNALRLLMALRGLAIAGQALTIIVVHSVMEIPLPWPMMAMGLMVLASITLISWVAKPTASAGMVTAQLALDVLALGFLLYCSGGAMNPFAGLFIIPVALAASLLPALQVGVIFGLTLVCSLVLVWWNIPLPHLHHYHLGEFFTLHVQGMLVAYVLAGGIIAVTVLRLATLARRRDAEIAALREAQMFDEAMVRTGVLAVGSAHGLSTPLASLTLLVQELRDESSASQNETLTLMQQEMDRAVLAVNSLLEAVGAPRGGSLEKTTLQALGQKLTQRWQKQHPHVQWDYRASSDALFLLTQSLLQTLDALAQNAVDAMATQLVLSVADEGRMFVLTLEDNGKGIDPSLLPHLGRAPLTNRAEGAGVGLWLGTQALKRLGGSLRLEALPHGTRVVLQLPKGYDA